MREKIMNTYLDGGADAVVRLQGWGSDRKVRVCNFAVCGSRVGAFSPYRHVTIGASGVYLTYV